MMLLQNGNNGGSCPFFWQESGVFLGREVAVSCQGSICLKAERGQPVASLRRNFCEAVAEGVDDQFQAVRDVQFGKD